MGGACSAHREMRYSCKILVRNPEWKKPLRRKWEDYINIELREIVMLSVDWIHMAQDRDRWWDVVNMVMNLRVT
jgi:hypothetical protein